MMRRLAIFRPAVWKAGARDRRGVGALEFALSLPLVIGFLLSGVEMVNCILQLNKAQRLASMLADLMAQSGQGSVAATEGQVYDLFTALKVSAKPINMDTSGRVILTVVQGVDPTNSGTVTNKFVTQQFDGPLITSLPLLGCHSSVTAPTFAPARTLAKDEILIHAQVTFAYKPVFFSRAFDMLNLPTLFTRTAAYRARRSDFSIQPDAAYPAKTNCATSTGLPTTTM